MSTPKLASPKRCAVYCRVSSNERLDQSFNSIDAQQEAGYAYIKSQSHEGWIAVSEGYDDGGFSGGNLDRPALKRLMSDIEAKKIDIVIVYKIDRLTRSLADFAKLVEIFDQHNVSFVSVTQQFNTTSSMGRLTLNILLSFAQFEREVTSERIRDKFAASKAKGIWMGGAVPLGYFVKDRLLLVKEPEASLVRRIYDDFIERRSLSEMAKLYKKEGILTRLGKNFTPATLFQILRAPVFLGKLPHKGKIYDGRHPAIITQAQWDQVQKVFQTSIDMRRYGSPRCEPDPILLRGLVFSTCGRPFRVNRTGKPSRLTYSYYVPVKRRQSAPSDYISPPLSTIVIDQLVSEQIIAILSSPHVVQAVWDRIRTLDPGITESEVILPMRNTGALWSELFPIERQRIARLLIERVVISAEGLEIIWREGGWHALAAEFAPGTIGAELQELESA